jgi:L,D-transpeptidase ErfK/SrfK
MKKVIIWLLLTACAGGAGAILYYTIKPLPMSKPTAELLAAGDTFRVVLPNDPLLAQKEIQRVQKAQAALQPKIPYIVIDTHSNHLSYRTADSVLFRATCSSGSGGILIDSVTKRKWSFNTPHGVFKVGRKIENPWWRKPDWAFVEEGEPVPKNESDRLDPNVLGDYAFGFGDGYFIHGTLYKRLLGISVTHGCVRLGDDDLKALYKVVPIGTPIYIF